jgi:2-polyprenyl-6-methoxyphenol hydroxylase-like FAD-dependent oxidoreductase
MLAGELALAGVDVVVVERRTAGDPADAARDLHPRGLLPRTLEVLDQRGIVDRFVAAGRPRPSLAFGGAAVDLRQLPTRHNHLVGLLQSQFERLLADWVHGALGVPILRGCEVVGFGQDDAGVDVELTGGGRRRAQYLVGCDGARSRVRQAAGIAFPGWAPTSSQLLAQADMAEEPALGMHAGGSRIEPVDRAKRGGPYRVVVVEQHLEHDREPTLVDLREALVATYGTDFGVHSPTSISRFGDACRQAASYRDGRVLLAGDAAHVHGPQGGQGLNVGVQDAVNLGWKLAQVVGGFASERLLDTYHAERHPVGARVLRHTMAQVALGRSDERSLALRDAVADLVALDGPQRRMAATMSGLDVRYDLGPGHPLVGRRMPDLDLSTADGPTTVFALLREARPVVLDVGAPGSLDLSPWGDRIRSVEAEPVGEWELPTAVVLRPDGHVAWAGEPTDPGLERALRTWFGPPASP